MLRMNVFPLAIPLAALLICSNLCGSSLAASFLRFVLDVSTDLSPLLARNLGLGLVVFTHGSGFPLTDTTSHELWTVGFADVDALHEEVKHTHVSPVVIHLKGAARQPREEPWTDIPASLKREPVALRDTISLAWPLAIDRFHEQQLQIIGRPQILRDPALRDGMPKSARLVEGLLVIIHNGLKEAALQFLQRHASRLSRCLCISNPVTRIGQASFKAVRQPPKEGFHPPFGQGRP